jgi:hypothetical protein
MNTKEYIEKVSKADNPQILYLKNKKSDRFQNDWTAKIEQLQARVKELEGYEKCWENLIDVLEAGMFPDDIEYIETEMKYLEKQFLGGKNGS